ncbi:OLC1v1008569C1 [Oldenlandia corymbosa var. corymbosa]|uniref:OLC1v1008569C1 n=1 Tax=Oldenlandia corymbosa var. corymbosa TaxID=529605 RepID=A0AAV1DPR0_OLDCO|nr:OLC1v1008569C1 [Oldenlandia corymbosa var. corymbosa]
MCVRCVASDTYPFSDSFDLALMPILVQRNVTFKYFYENCAEVIKGVVKMVKEVCVRAFKDILKEYARETSSTTGRLSIGQPNVSTTKKVTSHYDNHGKGTAQTPLHILSKGQDIEVAYDGTKNITPLKMTTVVTTSKEIHDSVQDQATIMQLMIPSMGGTGENGDVSFFSKNAKLGIISNPTPLIGQPTKPNYVTTEPLEIKHLDNIDDFSHIFKSSLNLIKDEDDSPDERTIFLTFSRGYPISANEVQEFFTKKFGDFIENIHMQQVAENEQVLFARVVARAPAFVNAVVEGGKAKYSINRKHVWARKYVRNKKCPPTL